MTDLYNGTLRIERVAYPVCRVCGHWEIIDFPDKDMPVKDIVAKLRWEGWMVSTKGLLCYQCKAAGKGREVTE